MIKLKKLKGEKDFYGKIIKTLGDYIRLCDGIIFTRSKIKVAKEETENKKIILGDFPIDTRFLPEEIKRGEEKEKKLLNRLFETEEILRQEYSIKI